LISKFNIDMADWKGPAFRRWLWSAECFNDKAMLRALRDLNIPGLRSNASLLFATAADHLAVDGRREVLAELRDLDFAAALRFRMGDSLEYAHNQPLLKCKVSAIRAALCGLIPTRAPVVSRVTGRRAGAR